MSVFNPPHAGSMGCSSTKVIFSTGVPDSSVEGDISLTISAYFPGGLLAQGETESSPPLIPRAKRA